MRKFRGGLLRLLLPLALLCAGPSLCYPQDTAPPPSTLSDSALIARLLTSLTQSKQEAANLRQALTLQVATFAQLRTAYDSLAQKLPSYEQTITALQTSLDNSDNSLSRAQADLSQAQALLADLRQQLQTASSALSSYKSATDKEVDALRLEDNGWRIAGITFGVLALGEAAYIAGHALGAWK